eukprot:9251447-Alexandrium_andersonii.AAC.1
MRDDCCWGHARRQLVGTCDVTGVWKRMLKVDRGEGCWDMREAAGDMHNAHAAHCKGVCFMAAVF